MTAVSCVAIGDGGYVTVSDDHHSCCSHGITSDVVNYLTKEHHKNIGYIAIGPDKQYYIANTNGEYRIPKREFRGPQDFYEQMKRKLSDLFHLDPGESGT